jgi:hypothetical protein
MTGTERHRSRFHTALIASNNSSKYKFRNKPPMHCSHVMHMESHRSRTLDMSQWREAPSQWWEAPSHCTHSTEAANAAAESRLPRTSADTSARAADELPPRKVDELSDATGIVRNDLSTTTAGAESCQSRFCLLRLRTQSFLQSFMPSFSTSIHESLQ